MPRDSDWGARGGLRIAKLLSKYLTDKKVF